MQQVDMHEIMEMWKYYNDEFQKKHNVKLGIMSFFVKATALGLKEFPTNNSVIDEERQEIIHKNYIDISVAISAKKGLVVPVLRNV